MKIITKNCIKESFRPGPGVVRKFRNKLIKKYPGIRLKILKFAANLFTHMRLRTVNRLAKSAEQPLRHSVKFDLLFLNSKTYFYPVWMSLDSGPIEYLDKKICDFWRKKQDKIVSMEALENHVFSWDSHEHHISYLVLTLRLTYLL